LGEWKENLEKLRARHGEERGDENGIGKYGQ
jgi:hypothetical protein